MIASYGHFLAGVKHDAEHSSVGLHKRHRRLHQMSRAQSVQRPYPGPHLPLMPLGHGHCKTANRISDECARMQATVVLHRVTSHRCVILAVERHRVDRVRHPGVGLASAVQEVMAFIDHRHIEVPASLAHRVLDRRLPLFLSRVFQPVRSPVGITIELVVSQRPREVVTKRLVSHNDDVPVGVRIRRPTLFAGRGRIRKPPILAGLEVSQSLRVVIPESMCQVVMCAGHSNIEHQRYANFRYAQYCGILDYMIGGYSRWGARRRCLTMSY